MKSFNMAWITCALVLCAVDPAFTMWQGGPQSGPPNNGGGNQNGSGRLSPASLDLDTCGCPTTFGDPVCETQTEWSIDKTTESGPFLDPDQDPFSFTVTVTEGPTTETLTATGTIRISNSGAQTPTLANVAVLLEADTPGAGDAPGPGGNNWTVLAVTAENEHAVCGNMAVTCDGNFDQSAGANLVLFDCDDMNDIIALTDGVEIPPAVDEDGDGRTGEDPALSDTIAAGSNCFGVHDNDGDGLLDEDPPDGIDNDLDGSIDEDGPDDDGDGLVDEDDNCGPDEIVEFCFEATYDISGLGLNEGDSLRIDLLVTFKGGGRRGGTCKLDVDCDGTIEDGKHGTDDEGEGHVRTVQQRHNFSMPACTPLCTCVTLEDLGAFSLDESCATVDSTNTLNEMICMGGEGTVTTRSIDGTVSCAGGTCSTSVTNTATLTCDEQSLISGSPASASFDVDCAGGRGGFGPGDFCSQTQGGWGTNNCAGNNTACLRDAHFDTIFPSGLVVGDPDGPDGDGLYSILLTSSAAVADYLPAGGTPSALTADQTDPETTSAGVLGGQLVAATLNVAFDAAGVGKCTLTSSCTFAFPPGTLGTLVYGNCVAANLQGLSVNDVIALANTAISGGGLPAGVSFSDLSDALAVLNEEFVDCDTVATGCLSLP